MTPLILQKKRVRYLRFVIAFVVFMICATVIAGIYQGTTDLLNWFFRRESFSFKEWFLEDQGLSSSLVGWMVFVRAGVLVALVNAFAAAWLPSRSCWIQLAVAASGPLLGLPAGAWPISAQLWDLDSLVAITYFNLLAIGLFLLGFRLLLRWDRRHWRLWTDPKDDVRIVISDWLDRHTDKE